MSDGLESDWRKSKAFDLLASVAAFARDIRQRIEVRSSHRKLRITKDANLIMMVDTQILSYAYKGHGNAVSGTRISSIVAHEFLEVYDANSTTRCRYYIKYLSGRHLGAPVVPPSLWKGGAIERLVLDFGGDYPQLIEFNSRATAAIINDRNGLALAHTLSSLDKVLQKKLRSRFTFLCEHIGACIPLVPQTTEIGIQLLSDFVQHHNVKANFRNSVNDMMILATAIAGHEQLLTDDNLLARFAAAQQQAPLREVGEGLIEIDFDRSMGVGRRLPNESKGYINRGWRIAVEKHRLARQG